MKTKETTLSSFVTKLDAELLDEDQVVLLAGGFAPAPPADANSNTGCNTDNCPCPITNNCSGDRD